MSKIPFKVSARTARLIGRENVSNADGAVIELVKNGHDADASGVVIIFGKNNDLFIIDNGHGMDKAVLEDIWMVIGTDSKEVDPYSPKRRVKTGAKGIGRFALDRLGQKVEMYTLTEESLAGYQWSIDWSEFEKESIVLSDIKAELKEIKNLNLADVLPSAYKDILDTKEFNISKKGTILHVSSLRDGWSKEDIEKLFQNLESLVPEMEKDSFSIRLFSQEHPKEFGLVQPLINEDFDYRIVAKYDSKTQKVNIEIHRNEFDVKSLEKNFNQVFKESIMKESPYTLADFKKGKFQDTLSVSDLLSGFSDSDNLLQDIGNFNFNLTFAKNRAPNREDLRKYPYKNADYASRGEWLGKFSGIKLFRDNFRVRPYGENGDDWLQLGERQSISPAGPGQRLGGYRVRPNQIAGSIYISRIENKAFDDKSSREGIQENETFYLFKNVLIGIISLLEEDRNKVFYSLSELNKKIDEKERKKAVAKSVVSHIKKGGSYSSEKEKDDATQSLVEVIDVYESQLEDQNEEIKILRSLASAGLITAAVAHELRGLENILTTRNRDLRKLIEPYVKEDDLKSIEDAFNPFVLLAEMEQTDKTIQEWLNYALMPLKRDKRKRKAIFLKDYFANLSKTWDSLLSDRKIKISLSNIDESYRVKMFAIDLDTIFNNLIINSVESFARKMSNKEREIIIGCEFDDKKYSINYSDNGAGLDKSFSKNPNEIFLPQKTAKRDSAGNAIGTGMGMYLVKSVVDDNNGAVELNKTKTGFSVTINLPSG